MKTHVLSCEQKRPAATLCLENFKLLLGRFDLIMRVIEIFVLVSSPSICVYCPI